VYQIISNEFSYSQREKKKENIRKNIA